APRHVGRVLGPWAEPRVHEDRAPVGADQVGAEVEADLVRLGQVGAVRLPLVLGDRREEVAEVELERAVGERQDLDVADADHVVGHGGPEAYHTLLHYRRTRRSPPTPPSAPPGTFDAVRDGLVDLSYVTASYTPARHILPLMAELPGSGDTSLVNSVAYSRIYWKHFHKVGEYKGVKLLGVFTHGPGQMFTKRPVRSIADVQGLKIRTGGGVAEQVAKALGASAFVKPAPESYELLSSGVADGVFFPLESIISFKLDTVLEQATLFPGGMYASS